MVVDILAQILLTLFTFIALLILRKVKYQLVWMVFCGVSYHLTAHNWQK